MRIRVEYYFVILHQFEVYCVDDHVLYKDCYEVIMKQNIIIEVIYKERNALQTAHLKPHLYFYLPIFT